MTVHWPSDWQNPDGTADTYRGDVHPEDSVLYDLYTEREAAENILFSLGFDEAYDTEAMPVPVEDDLVPDLYELDSDQGYTIEVELAGQEDIYAINVTEAFEDSRVIWSLSTLEDFYQYLEDREAMQGFAQVVGGEQLGTIEEYKMIDRPDLLDRARQV
ncbi:MAG: hypothetical protein MUP66_01180 [Candidatus Nanohaloarchaeota archaeon QJJ-5]|nr:hypothetical protein [Candidatus Nanohaloarchaeota archaeon QJJ-5]